MRVALRRVVAWRSLPSEYGSTLRDTRTKTTHHAGGAQTQLPSGSVLLRRRAAQRAERSQWDHIHTYTPLPPPQGDCQGRSEVGGGEEGELPILTII